MLREKRTSQYVKEESLQNESQLWAMLILASHLNSVFIWIGTIWALWKRWYKSCEISRNEKLYEEVLNWFSYHWSQRSCWILSWECCPWFIHCNCAKHWESHIQYENLFLRILCEIRTAIYSYTGSQRILDWRNYIWVGTLTDAHRWMQGLCSRCCKQSHLWKNCICSFLSFSAMMSSLHHLQPTKHWRN